MHPNIYKKSLWIIRNSVHHQHASKYLPTESPSTERCSHQCWGNESPPVHTNWFNTKEIFFFIKYKTEIPSKLKQLQNTNWSNESPAMQAGLRPKKTCFHKVQNWNADQTQTTPKQKMEQWITFYGLRPQNFCLLHKVQNWNSDQIKIPKHKLGNESTPM